jgi:hypothetical protein
MGTIVDLRALFKSTIQYRGRNFEALKDRHIRDTENVLKTDVGKYFFVTLGAKQKSQANFQGDKSLVKEANVFLPLQVRGHTRSLLTITEFFSFWHKGYAELKKLVPDTITVDEDNLGNWSTGAVLQPFYDNSAAPVANATPGDQRLEGRRTYIVPENKLFPGGRAVECLVSWQEAGGNGLVVASCDLAIEFYGVEFEPARS